MVFEQLHSIEIMYGYFMHMVENIDKKESNDKTPLDKHISVFKNRNGNRINRLQFSTVDVIQWVLFYF